MSATLAGTTRGRPRHQQRTATPPLEAVEVQRLGSGAHHTRREPRDGGGRDLAALLHWAQQGSAEAREMLMRASVPFIVRTAQQVCRRKLFLGQDDEASVALVAFNEAIDRYRPDRGTTFTGFVKMVIRNRVIDSLRRNRAAREIPVAFPVPAAQVGSVGHGILKAELREAMAAYRAIFEAVELRDEISAYREVLRAHGMTLKQVIRACPRHADARQRAIAAARAVVEEPAWRVQLTQHRRLPLKQMAASRRLGMSRRSLERHRTYIVAMALLFCCCGELLRRDGAAADASRGRARGA